MIIDSSANASKYRSLHPLFNTVFQYIAETDLNNLQPGTCQVEDDDVKAIVSESVGKNCQQALEEFECHRQYIGIQVCIRGQEKFGWKPLHKCSQSKDGYNELKDVEFWNDAPDT